MQIEKVKISQVKNNPNNPRVIKNDDFRKLVKSIKEAPWMLQLRSIIVNDDNIVLGGNQRLRACKEAGLKEVYIIKASSLTEEQQREFIVKDNLSSGEWDWDALANEFEIEDLENWGLDLPVQIEDSDEFGTAFDLPNGDKEPFQQMTFTLADEQAEQVRNAIEDIKRTEEYKYCETMGNDNSNGNALYLIIMQWAEQRK
tara:strand:- start:1080 stop:1679 length:600 start_codon:yes stop_codon:yes gene_type:complete